jgi:hypothetical protein
VRADTVGVFQIESRAQMSMLPRLQARVFYDLVVQVAIVRPGPIQGGMVHPYLQARERLAAGASHWTLEKTRTRAALKRTLGVPIFQEQVMQIAMIAAGFQRRHGRRPAPGHGRLEAQGRRAQVRAPIDRRHGGTRLPHRLCTGAFSSRCWALANTAFLKATPTALRCWPMQQLAQVPRTRLLSGGAAQFAAHGFLQRLATGAGRAPPRRARAAQM